MRRYIDADKMKSIKSIQSASFNSIESIREWIDNQPTADVVEVVRCKDCKYWQDQEDGVVEVPICTRQQNAPEENPLVMIIGEDGYCSYGERAEDEANQYK